MSINGATSPRLKPFEKAVNEQVAVFGVTQKEAIDAVQTQYADFKHRNERLLERQNSNVNSNETGLIAHTTLLATLTLTVVGFLAQNFGDALNQRLKVLLILTVTFEIVAAFLGLWNYVLNIRLFKQWGAAYQAIDEEIDRRIDDSSIQYVGDLREVENAHTKDVPRNTPTIVSDAMIIACVAGLATLVLLYVGHFFDLPVIK